MGWLCNVFISDTVVMEASCGDEEKAQRRLWEIRDFSVLEADPKTQELAKYLVKEKAVPEKTRGRGICCVKTAIGIGLQTMELYV